MEIKWVTNYHIPNRKVDGFILDCPFKSCIQDGHQINWRLYILDSYVQ